MVGNTVIHIKPFSKTIPAETWHNQCGQLAACRPKRNSFASAYGFTAYPDKRILTRAVIWNGTSPFFKDSAEEFPKAPSLIVYPCLRERQ